MRSLICALVGHRPVARAVAGTNAIHEWTSCTRCKRVLTKPTRTARANRAARRHGETSKVEGTTIL